MRRKTWIDILAASVTCALLASTVIAAPRSIAPQRGAGTETARDNPGAVGCTATARSVVKGCRDETAGGYWLAIGKCQNISAAPDRGTCKDAAREALVESRDECGEQFEARREVCALLGEAPYDPVVDPLRFSSTVDNPFLPYVPGTTWIYEGETDEGRERIVVEATGATREILGVPCRVVRDRVYLDGALIEDTLDWYAQDVDGNVWYFGELSYELEDGVIVNLSGSWEAGIDGARPGIVMKADPAMRDAYRQEFLLAEAEDMAQVVSLGASAVVPWGAFSGCRQTREWTPIDPEAEEFKTYAFGVGLVLEENRRTGERVELIEVIGPTR